MKCASDINNERTSILHMKHRAYVQYHKRGVDAKFYGYKKICTECVLIIIHHHHHHYISVMQLGHLLTRSGRTYPEVSSTVYQDSFCQLGSSVSLPRVIYFEAFHLHVVSSFSCIPVICPKLVLFLTPLQFVYLFCNLSVSLNRPVQRLKISILPQDLPCSGPVTHSGEILTTGKSHGKQPFYFVIMKHRVL